MPEGDTLRITARRLSDALVGTVLTRAELRWPGVAGAALVGRTVDDVVAYGKHLLIRFDHGWTLHTHLRMEGSWSVVPTAARRGTGRPDVRAVLGNAQWLCLGHRLGAVDLVRTRDERAVVGHLGPDILGELRGTGELERLVATVHGAGRPIAEALLDQRLVAGIGTIFMSEGLFAERIWPWTPAGEVPDVRRLLGVIRSMMQRSVAAGTHAGAGRRIRVHARAGEPCVVCGTLIERGAVLRPAGARPVFYCPRCQARCQAPPCA